eukprot:TRINITY_DN51366_c0_g1_i1.p1 TRINITY_DN51366_c0_g1~~TRINITY_DN51366_c0_g1_i1.p1  ORF type:complete len:627 (+),score=-11.15 TRINITY_DN51366_c0_g1_i1:84-1883(+)
MNGAPFSAGRPFPPDRAPDRGPPRTMPWERERERQRGQNRVGRGGAEQRHRNQPRNGGRRDNQTRRRRRDNKEDANDNRRKRTRRSKTRSCSGSSSQSQQSRSRSPSPSYSTHTRSYTESEYSRSHSRSHSQSHSHSSRSHSPSHSRSLSADRSSSRSVSPLSPCSPTSSPTREETITVCKPTLEEEDVKSLLERIFNSQHQLEAFNVNTTSLTDDDIHSITEELQGCSNLSSINWNNTPLTEKSIHSILNCCNGRQQLQTLCLPRTSLEVAHVTKIAEYLTKHPELSHLDLSNNQLESQSFIVLLQSIMGNSKLSNLKLYSDEWPSTFSLGTPAAIHLADLIAPPRSLALVQLDLSGLFRHVAEHAFLLLEGLKHCTTLEHLALDNSSLDVSGAHMLSRALQALSSQRGSALVSLSLAHNQLGDDGARILFDAIVAYASLQELNLTNNNITTKGTSNYLGQLLEAGSLKLSKLDLSDNPIMDNAKLCTRLKFSLWSHYSFSPKTVAHHVPEMNATLSQEFQDIALTTACCLRRWLTDNPDLPSVLFTTIMGYYPMQPSFCPYYDALPGDALPNQEFVSLLPAEDQVLEPASSARTHPI